MQYCSNNTHAHNKSFTNIHLLGPMSMTMTYRAMILWLCKSVGTYCFRVVGAFLFTIITSAVITHVDATIYICMSMLHSKCNV